MLAKTIPRAKSRDSGTALSSRFDASINYAMDPAQAKGALAQIAHDMKFEDSIEYVSNAKEGGAPLKERVVGVLINGVVSVETAAVEMEAVACLSRVKDPVVHFTINYDSGRGEKPPLEQVRADVERMLREREFTDGKRQRDRATGLNTDEAKNGKINQYIVIVHGDTDSVHCHVVVNRVATNGVVSDDPFYKIRGENVCAAIARERGWEVVAGRHNHRQLMAQALERGATPEEIGMLERREAVTLDRAREQIAAGTGKPNGESVAEKNGRRGSFAQQYGQTIRDIFSQSDSYKSFVAGCADAGVEVKYTDIATKNDKRKIGVAFAEISAIPGERVPGDSGTRVGVTARQMGAKFGAISPEPPKEQAQAVAAIQQTVVVSKVQQAPPIRLASAEQPRPVRQTAAEAQLTRRALTKLTPGERELIAAVKQQRTATIQSDRTDKLLAIVAAVSVGVRKLRQRRNAKRQAEAQAKFDIARAGKAPSLLEQTLAKIDAQRGRLDERLAKAPPYLVEKLRDEVAALDMQAQYAVFKDAEWRRQNDLIRAASDKAYLKHQRKLSRQIKNAEANEDLIRSAAKFFGGWAAVKARRKTGKLQARIKDLRTVNRAEWTDIKAGFGRPAVPAYSNWLAEQSGPTAVAAMRRQAEVDEWKAGKSGKSPEKQPVSPPAALPTRTPATKTPTRNSQFPQDHGFAAAPERPSIADDLATLRDAEAKRVQEAQSAPEPEQAEADVKPADLIIEKPEKPKVDAKATAPRQTKAAPSRGRDDGGRG